MAFVQCIPSQGFHVCSLSSVLCKIFAWFRHTCGAKKLYFVSSVSPTCLPCGLHPPGSIVFAIFLFFYIPTHLYILPSILGQNLYVLACIIFHSSGPRRPFTWLQISIWIDSARKLRTWKTYKNNQKGKGDPASSPTCEKKKILLKEQHIKKLQGSIQWNKKWISRF